MSVINKYGLNGRDDFIGFTYNGHHSSEYRIIRVSNGSRYEEELIPAPKDTTIDIPGMDGSLFLNSKMQTRTFNIEFAYDDLGEKDIRKIREWLSPKKACELIFDEEPYKIYSAKINGTPKLSYICFDDKGKRVYKGEGNAQFICYYPFARGKYKYKDEYTLDKNSDEWIEASGLKNRMINLIQRTRDDREWRFFYNSFFYSQDIKDGKNVPWTTRKAQHYFGIAGQKNYYPVVENAAYWTPIKDDCNLYNSGDKPTPWKMYFWVLPADENDKNINEGRDYYEHGCDKNKPILLDSNGAKVPFSGFHYTIVLSLYHTEQDNNLFFSVPASSGDIWERKGLMVIDLSKIRERGTSNVYCIDNELRLINGITAGANDRYVNSNLNGKIYNNALVKGDFFDIPQGENVLYAKVFYNEQYRDAGTKRINYDTMIADHTSGYGLPLYTCMRFWGSYPDNTSKIGEAAYEALSDAYAQIYYNHIYY